MFVPVAICANGATSGNDAIGAAAGLGAAWAWGITVQGSRLSMTFENLLIERDDAVAIVTLNRPKVLNALNTPDAHRAGRAMTAFKADAGVRAIVLTGAGEKVVRRRRRHQRAGSAVADRGQGTRAPRTADFRRDRTTRQARDRGGQRIRARRRLRAGHGVHAAHCRRHRALRATGNQSRASFPAMPAVSVCRGWSARVWRSRSC